MGVWTSTLTVAVAFTLVTWVGGKPLADATWKWVDGKVCKNNISMWKSYLHKLMELCSQKK